MVFKYNTKIDISLERYVNNNILQSFGRNMFILFYFFMDKHKNHKERSNMKVPCIMVHT